MTYSLPAWRTECPSYTQSLVRGRCSPAVPSTPLARLNRSGKIDRSRKRKTEDTAPSVLHTIHWWQIIVLVS